MRMKSCGLGLLAMLILASGAGCKKSPSEATNPKLQATNQPSTLNPQPSTTIARVHWLGKKQIAAQTNSIRFMSLWNLPESANLESQTLNKLALALAGVSQASNVLIQPPANNSPATNYLPLFTNYQALVASHPAAAQLRPLLDDMVREEWYLEVQQSGNQPGELALAVRLDEQHASLWTSNLSAVLGSITNVQSLPAQTNRHAWRLLLPSGLSTINHQLSTIEMARAGDWTLVGLARERNTRLDDFAARIQHGHTPGAESRTSSAFQMDPTTRKVSPTPGSQAATNWIEVDLDPQRLASALPFDWNLPGTLPRVFLTVAGDSQGVRTRADLDFPSPLPLELEAWNIPTNLIHDPLVGFAAVRGIRPWLKSFKPWEDLHLGTPPNQAYFWAQGGPPNLHFMAAPSAEVSNQVAKLSELVLGQLNPLVATNPMRMGAFVRQTNSPGVVWQGIPWFSPVLDYSDSGGNRFLVAGLSSTRISNRPAPAGLFQQLEANPKLVAYDWEVTRPCIEAWTQMGQLTRHVFSLARMTHTAGLAWLAALTPKLTNSVTAIELSSPTRLSFVRSSGVGFTGVELQLLADWLESLEFPRGLHTFTTPPQPTEVRGSRTDGSVPQH
jgi:hypothetical protein